MLGYIKTKIFVYIMDIVFEWNKIPYENCNNVVRRLNLDYPTIEKYYDLECHEDNCFDGYINICYKK